MANKSLPALVRFYLGPTTATATTTATHKASQRRRHKPRSNLEEAARTLLFRIIVVAVDNGP